MPSIFVWKSDTINTSKKQIRYYSGSNWSLEDDDYSSKSYMFLNQIVIPGFNDSVITFNAKKMPQNWVGSHLLEVTNVAYEHIKTDNYGTLDRIGEWMRFISKHDIEFDSESLQNELVCIKKWINTTNKQHSVDVNQYNNNTIITEDKIQQTFQEFLMKYSMPLPNPESLLISSTNIKLGVESTYNNHSHNNNNNHNHDHGHKKRYYNKSNVFNNKNRDRF
jgi:hypothetical protein